MNGRMDAFEERMLAVMAKALSPAPPPPPPPPPGVAHSPVVLTTQPPPWHATPPTATANAVTPTSGDLFVQMSTLQAQTLRLAQSQQSEAKCLLYENFFAAQAAAASQSSNK